MLSVVEELGSEVLDSLVGFFLLGGDELPLGYLGVVIDCTGEGGEGCGNLAYVVVVMLVVDVVACRAVAVAGWSGDLPWRAGDEVAGASAKASRSRRTKEDCLRAELKREFWGWCQLGLVIV